MHPVSRAGNGAHATRSGMACKKGRTAYRFGSVPLVEDLSDRKHHNPIANVHHHHSFSFGNLAAPD
jgi:hypothetical protein